jgi:transmembrane 9 superfamily protein 1
MLKIYFLIVLAVVCVTAHDDQRYDHGESIPLFVDNVVPEDNPSELYRYYSLPFCRADVEKHKSQSFGEMLQGSRKIYSPYNLPFNVSVHDELCTKELSSADVAAFRLAIQHGYHFTMYYDEILLRGFVGTIDSKGEVFLHTHLNFHFTYNRDRVIEADVVPDLSKSVRLPATETAK